MTVDSMKVIFKNKIVEDTILLPGGATVVVETFTTLFSSVESNLYADFIAVDNGQMGYKDFFDQCKAEEILN